MTAIAIPSIFLKFMEDSLSDILNLDFFFEKEQEQVTVTPVFQNVVYSLISGNAYKGYFILNYNNDDLKKLYLLATERNYIEDESEISDFAKELVNISGGRFIDSFNLDSLDLNLPILIHKNDIHTVNEFSSPLFTSFSLKIGRMIPFRIYAFLGKI